MNYGIDKFVKEMNGRHYGDCLLKAYVAHGFSCQLNSISSGTDFFCESGGGCGGGVVSWFVLQ